MATSIMIFFGGKKRGKKKGKRGKKEWKKGRKHRKKSGGGIRVELISSIINNNINNRPA